MAHFLFSESNLGTKSSIIWGLGYGWHSDKIDEVVILVNRFQG
jgi:hypothetical protein